MKKKELESKFTELQKEKKELLVNDNFKAWSREKEDELLDVEDALLSLKRSKSTRTGSNQ